MSLCSAHNLLLIYSRQLCDLVSDKALYDKIISTEHGKKVLQNIAFTLLSHWKNDIEQLIDTKEMKRAQGTPKLKWSIRLLNSQLRQVYTTLPDGDALKEAIH